MSAQGVTPGSGWPFGDWLRSAREDAGLTQLAASERAGLSRTIWQQYETGRRADGRPVRPKARTVIDVANAVEADPAHALKLLGIDPTTVKPASKHGKRQVSERELLDGFAELNMRQQEAVVELVNAMRPGLTRSVAAELPPPGEPLVSEISRTETSKRSRPRS